ncbi:MAG: alpha/beta fold hydrolase [Pseudomonadota bacterium]
MMQADWEEAMADRDSIKALLGPDYGSTRIERVEDRETDTTLRRLQFHTTGGEAIPALYAPAAAPAPAILYCHAHGNHYDIGMQELKVGRPALLGPYLPDLQAAGFSVLCLEMPCFGARSALSEEATAKARLWHGRTLFGQMLAEQAAALDWLKAQPEIDSSRIGVMGISMGGTLAWWLAALEPHLATAVSMCCFADLSTLIAQGAHDGHGPYMTVPGLLKHTSTGRLSALAAPTPLLHCVGLTDWSTPPEAFAIAQRELEAGYEAAGAADALAFHIATQPGHEETPQMRKTVLEFLTRRLGCDASTTGP